MDTLPVCDEDAVCVLEEAGCLGLGDDGAGGAGDGDRAIAFHSEPALGETPNPPLWTPAFAGVTVDGVSTNSESDCPRGYRT